MVAAARWPRDDLGCGAKEWQMNGRCMCFFHIFYVFFQFFVFLCLTDVEMGYKRWIWVNSILVNPANYTSLESLECLFC